MQRLRQRHSDKSQSVIELRNSKWQIQLTAIRPSASSINRVPSQPVTLRKAQNLGRKGDGEAEPGARKTVFPGKSFENGL